MNWVCHSCGYENEYNDESKPTECLCCGNPASEEQLNQARCELEQYHIELECQERLEQIRQEVIRRQEKMNHLISRFTKCVKAISTAFIFSTICMIVLVGMKIYQGDVSPKYIGYNMKNNSVLYIGNFTQNIDDISKKRDNTVIENAAMIIGNEQEKVSDISKNIKIVGNSRKPFYENRKQNLAFSQSKILSGWNNFAGNWSIFLKQASSNFSQLKDSISKKWGGHND